MDTKNQKPSGPGASDFASQGGYGPGPVGRGPYHQTDTYATGTEVSGTGDADQRPTPEEAQRANEDARKGHEIETDK